MEINSHQPTTGQIRAAHIGMLLLGLAIVECFIDVVPSAKRGMGVIQILTVLGAEIIFIVVRRTTSSVKFRRYLFGWMIGGVAIAMLAAWYPLMVLLGYRKEW